MFLSKIALINGFAVEGRSKNQKRWNILKGYVYLARVIELD